MQSILFFFENLPSSYRAAILIGGLVLFWAIEGLIPLSKIKYKKTHHAGLNLFFTFTTVIVNFSLAFLLYHASDFCVANKFGFYYWLNFSITLKIIICLMLLDFIGAYLVHWLQHEIKPMWQFHIIHHTDTYLDTTSANRHHPGESVFRALFTALAIFITGAPFGLVIFYQSISALFSQFNHANILLPNWLDKAISYIIVSPNMHKLHHHFKLPLTDSNYGNIFSIWDRIFGTYINYKKELNIQYGLDTYPLEKETNHLGELLKIPFKGYRKN